MTLINILEIEDSIYKKNVIQKFLQWSKEIRYLNLSRKFNDDQNNLKRFELLVHIDQIPKRIFAKENLLKKNYDEFVEGFKTEIIKESAYRNQKLIKKAKQELGTTCNICEFNFEKTYGLHGKGFIEIHHLFPVSKGERTSNVTDLMPVCANCHRMLHKGRVTRTKDDIKEMIKEAKGST